MKTIILILLFLPTIIMAQVSGTVNSKSQESLIGVNVYWSGTTQGTFTMESGKFSIPEPKEYPANLIFSYVGFESDTIQVFTKNQNINIKLKQSIELKAAEVVERKQSTSISLIKPINVESIGAEELTRAACCNISEAFETNASVDVVSSDGVTGTKKIQMLGLDGIYTSLQFENIPFLRGLANLHGLSHIPGTWVESVQISKGTGSIVNGYEPMTGQINLELLKPDELNELLFVNLYGNNMGRAEANVHFGGKINEKWSSVLLIHANTLQQKNDNNNDGFLDMPLKDQINVFNRWKFKGPKYMAQFGFRYLSENIRGGQLDYDENNDFGTTNNYGTGSSADHLEMFFKNGIVFKGCSQRSLALIVRGMYHQQDMFMGLKTYNGTEKYGYANLIYMDKIGTPAHKYKVGLSYVYDDFQEEFNGVEYNRTEQVPGVFAEYTYMGDKFGAVIGARDDFHNLYGNQFSPKLNFKYNFSERGASRLSFGRGFRVPNIFVENASTFVSSRLITITNNVEPEVAWNGGVSLTQKVSLFEKDLTVHGEYFYTWFENQLFVNRENPGELKFDNLTGESYSHAVQVELAYEPLKVLHVKVAGKYLDVKSTYEGDLKSVPLVPNWRGLFSIGYKTLNKKWQADFTTQFVGVSRIPSTQGNLPENTLKTKSDPYVLMNAQVTRRFRWIEVYIGAENLGNFKQSNAIVSADQPFSSEFDASMIWGPVNGRVIYAGVNLKFFKK